MLLTHQPNFMQSAYIKKPESFQSEGMPVWVRVSCPRCGLNRSINGIGRCLDALLIYRPSRRRKALDISHITAFQWWPDEDGKDRVHAITEDGIREERGTWVLVQGDGLTFRRHDRRRTSGRA